MSSPDWMERHRARKLERLLGPTDAALPLPADILGDAVALAAARRGPTRPALVGRALRGARRVLSGWALALLPLAGLLGVAALILR